MKISKLIMCLIIFLVVFNTYTTNSYGFILRLFTDNLTPNTVHPPIHFGLYDEQGKYVGYNINNPSPLYYLQENQNFLYISDVEPINSPTITRITHELTGTLPDGTIGIYKLVIFGQDIAIYKLQGGMHERQDRKAIYGNFTITGLSATGNIRYFEIKYNPGQAPVIIRISTSNDLIADITIAQKLGLIGNSHFVSETIEEINKIEKERLEPQEPDDKSDKDKKKDDKPKLTPTQKAKKEYTELLSEITEKYNKPESDEFVKQEAYTVLREDIEYIIGHL